MKKGTILLIIMAVSLLIGCNKTPSTTVINNTPTKENVSSAEETIDVESMPIINMSYEIVNETIIAGDKTITLNGYIGKPDSLEGLCTYYANMVEHEKYVDNMDFLFGDLLDQVDEDEYGYKKLIVFDGIYEHARYFSELYNLIESDRNSAFFRTTWIPISGEKIPVNMTMDEAIAKADGILEQIGVQGFTLEKVEYLDEVPMEGYWSNGDYYAVTYRQYLQGVPIVVRMNTGGMIGYSQVKIQERGIEYVYIEQLDYYVDRQIEVCITYEEALEIFLNYVSESSQYEGLGLESIAFEYVVKNSFSTNEYDFKVVPCWRFNVDINGSMDILIEAENGSLSLIKNICQLHSGSYDRLYGLGLE